MIKNCSIIEEQENGRDFRLECPSGCTWQDILAITARINQFADVQIKALTPPEQPMDVAVIEE